VSASSGTVVSRRRGEPPAHLTDGIIKFIGVSGEPRRIVGVAADVDDEHIALSRR
jgi:hypothetical protein